MPFSLSRSSQRAWMCQGLCFKCLYLYWNCPPEGSLIGRCSGCRLLISLDLDHKYLAWWTILSCCCEPPFDWPSWLGAVVVIFLTLCLCFCCFPSCLCLGAFSKACLHASIPVPQYMLLPTQISMWLLGRDFTPSPCLYSVTPTQALLQVISLSPYNWPWTCSWGHTFSRWWSPSLLPTNGLSLITQVLISRYITSLLPSWLGLYLPCFLSLQFVLNFVPLLRDFRHNLVPPWMIKMKCSEFSQLIFMKFLQYRAVTVLEDWKI